MTRVEESAKLYIPAARVWEVIGDFGAIDRWHPSVLGCTEDWEGTQKRRRLDVGEDEPVVERLDEADDAAMRQAYTFVSGPLPVRDYTAVLQVHADDGNSCTVSWTGAFEPAGVDPDTAVETIRGLYRKGLDHLRFQLGA